MLSMVVCCINSSEEEVKVIKMSKCSIWFGNECLDVIMLSSDDVE